jgi:CSLREA domain-containing protein
MRGQASFLALLFVALVFGAAGAKALTFTVNNASDGAGADDANPGNGVCDNGAGRCTLRAAIQEANALAGNDVIVFSLPVPSTINLTSALPDLSTNINISGPGADKLTVQRSPASGTPQFRIFTVTTTGAVTFSGLTISNGSAPPNNQIGGGIYNASTGTVNVTNSIVSGSVNTYAGGGIYNNGPLNVTNSTISGNFAVYGGAIFNNAAVVNVTNSTLVGNTGSQTGGGILNTGVGLVNVTNSTLSGNFAASGGGIYNENGTVNVTNSTLGSNSARVNGGGIYNNTGSTVVVTNSTISGNSANVNGNGYRGGGIFNFSANSAVFVKSSLIALNTGANPDVSGNFTSQGFNLIGKNDGAATSFPAGNPNANNDIVGTLAALMDPKLDPNGLKNNGGPTQTIALLFGSPAIDKGSGITPAGTTLPTDQRGAGFQRTFNDPSVPDAAGDGTDIGAFEVQTAAPPTPTPTPTATPTATPGLVANVSTRLPVGTGDNVLIEGFSVQGPAGSTKKIIVRAIGPFLATCCGITDALANPTLEIHDPSNGNAIVASNDDWKVTQFGSLITADQSAEIAASGFAPGNDLESAIIANLPPGSYTAVVRGVGNSVGTGVVDAFDLSSAASARLVNIATRGLIQPGDQLMIAGFIIQNGSVRAVISAIGPSLAAFGITNALADTTLQLRDIHGTIVVENDDWKIRTNGTSQQAELEATGLQPTNDLEAAVLTTLPPGQYSALVRGKPESTGIGVVQVYFLP